MKIRRNAKQIEFVRFKIKFIDTVLRNFGRIYMDPSSVASSSFEYIKS